MKDKKANPILQETIDQWKQITKEQCAIENVITERIGYIVRFIFSTFNKKLLTWYYADAPEGSMGSLARAFCGEKDALSVVVENEDRRESRYRFVDMDAVLNDGTEWDFSGGEFPERWLFEDFEQELIDGKKKFEEKEAARKLKMKEARSKQTEEDKKLAAEAKSKLSKKELAALRRTL